MNNILLELYKLTRLTVIWIREQKDRLGHWNELETGGIVDSSGAIYMYDRLAGCDSVQSLRIIKSELSVEILLFQEVCLFHTRQRPPVNYHIWPFSNIHHRVSNATVSDSTVLRN